MCFVHIFGVIIACVLILLDQEIFGFKNVYPASG